MTRRNLKCLLVGAASCLLVVGGSHFIHVPSAAESSSYPASPELEQVQLVSSKQNRPGSNCPTGDATNLVLVAEATGESQQYQIWQMTIDGMPVTQVTTLFGEVCGKISDTRTIRDPKNQSLFDGIDRAVALLLAENYYSYQIAQVGGVEAYRAGLLEFLENYGHHDGSKPTYTDVEISALEATGVVMPEDLYNQREHRGYEPL